MGITSNQPLRLMKGASNMAVQHEQVMGIIRHFITFLGGYLVSRGKLSPTDAETIAGAVAGIGGVAWSFLAKAPPKQPQ